jgi:CrcB protein
VTDRSRATGTQARGESRGRGGGEALTLLAVLLGGAVGTALRLGIDALLPHSDDSFPWATLGINVAGSFALGALVSLAWHRTPGWLRAGLGPGLLGSFTTFSALTVSLVTLGAAGAWMPAAAYLVASIALGLAAALLGLRLGRRSPAIDEAGE